MNASVLNYDMEACDTSIFETIGASEIIGNLSAAGSYTSCTELVDCGSNSSVLSKPSHTASNRV